jgi:asparagine synthase (glutamine-hydrolysing)
MCGIAGFASENPLLDAATLNSMRDALTHRGPDDYGSIIWGPDGLLIPSDLEQGAVGLAHRRLSIIDLSSAGHQPMCNEDGMLWISYNGEFYNFKEYRQDLLQKHSFSSNTDTETILHLFEEKGIENTLACINGMFAFALWDVRKRCLFLARDRLGKKPLYYVHRPDGALLFASEIKALLASSLVDANAVDPAALIQHWSYGYTTGEQTIYPQIKRLLPGHYGVWENGHFETHEYWDCPFGVGKVRSEPLPELADELESLLCDSIRLRLVSDVPVGLFLSGGIDSALIASLTCKKVGAGLNSFTIGFSHAAFDEAPYAAAIANHLGISNTMLPLAEDMLPSVPTIADHFDELFGDSSAIPTYFLCKLAREHVTVALTGDAGDELFAGYRTYAKALQLWGDSAQRRLFREPRSLIRAAMDEAFRWMQRHQLQTVLELQMPPRHLRKVLSPQIWHALGKASPYKERERWYGRTQDADLLSKLQYMNLKTYMVDDVLVKVDRMSMASSLECRCPFLDYRVVEFAARLPYYAKVDELGRQKNILRHILRKYVPDLIMDRPKQGFAVPWAEWCRGEFGATLREAWIQQNNPYHVRSAAKWLFPEGRDGNPFHQWYAFTVLRSFERSYTLR